MSTVNHRHTVPGELGHVRSFPFLDFWVAFNYLFLGGTLVFNNRQGTSHLFRNVLLVSLLLASYHLLVCLNTIPIWLLPEYHLVALVAICTRQYQTMIALTCALGASPDLPSYSSCSFIHQHLLDFDIVIFQSLVVPAEVCSVHHILNQFP